MSLLLALSLVAAAALWPGGDGDSAPEHAAWELASPDPNRRLAAITRLGALPHPDGPRRLTGLLNHADASVRFAAARALARAGHAEELERLAARASSESAAARFEALALLREAPVLPDSARRAAERALADSDSAMRLVALELLTAHPSADSVFAATGAIGDSNREVRLAAIRAAGMAGDSRALVPLLDRLDGPDRVERVAIIEALGGIPSRPNLSAGPALARQLDDANDDVRTAAVDALARLRWDPAVPALGKLAARPGRDFLSRRAVLALGSIGSAAAIDSLVELMRQPPPAADVLDALRQVGRPAVQAVARILPEVYPLTAAAGVKLLGDIGDRAATPALTALLANRPAVGLAAARALGMLRDPQAVPVLTAAVSSAQYAATTSVREAALDALAAIGDPRAAVLNVIEAAAGDPEVDVRVAALRLATAVRGGLSRTTLAARLGDGEPAVRRAAIDAAAAVVVVPQRTSLLLEALARAQVGRLPGEEVTLADALEATVRPADEPLLWNALTRSSSARGRAALLASLAAAHPAGAALAEADEAVLARELTGGGALARAAAEVLAVASLRPRTLAGALAVLPRLEAATRTRLCPALARADSPAGDAALVNLLDGDADDGVRAAAAWAAARRRGEPSVAAALQRARVSTVGPVAHNATLALQPPPAMPRVLAPGVRSPPAIAASAAATGPAAADWVRVRLFTLQGFPDARRWLRVHTRDQAIWTITDETGEARVSALPPGPYRVAAHSADFRVRPALTVAPAARADLTAPAPRQPSLAVTNEKPPATTLP